jgi:hypothetical protein
MRSGRRIDVLVRALGDRDEMPICELRAAVGSAFSEAELLRRGTWYCGRETKISGAYKRGDSITSSERCRLIELGISQAVNAMKRDCRNFATIDTKRGVVSRVRG